MCNSFISVRNWVMFLRVVRLLDLDSDVEFKLCVIRNFFGF